MKFVKFNGTLVPEQNIDQVLGFSGGQAQVALKFLGEEKPDLVDKIEALRERVIECVLRTPDGTSLSGIYVVDDVKVDQMKAWSPPIWKVGVVLRRV